MVLFFCHFSPQTFFNAECMTQLAAAAAAAAMTRTAVALQQPVQTKS
jgi:hypothetical protein